MLEQKTINEEMKVAASKPLAKLAKQADGSVVVRMGDTMILARIT